MSRFYYDFHIHSCLSPCGDSDMTPNNIVNMAKLKGLDVIALTDHNSCKNCPAAMKAGKEAGLLVLPGMELCSNEDIHCICLFPALEGALAFAAFVRSLMPGVLNRPDIFGEQLILDENDNVSGREELLLINAADISINDVCSLAGKYGGAAFPAHADKASNGILATLGGIPPEAGFNTLELSSACNEKEFLAQNKEASRFNLLRDSDAHYLWQISERDNFLDLEILNSDSIILTIKQEKKQGIL